MWYRGIFFSSVERGLPVQEQVSEGRREVSSMRIVASAEGPFKAIGVGGRRSLRIEIRSFLEAEGFNPQR
jgi:hypothetical protein